MSSRLVAVSSSTAKRKLVQLLFGENPKPNAVGLDLFRHVDHSLYSYSDLKSEYLFRIQQLHPDKFTGAKAEREAAKALFLQLKDAWSQYEIGAKMMKKLKAGETDANFTMFGVGCSFSDNDRERDLRIEFMDQACRGWFSSGALGDGPNGKAPEEAAGKNINSASSTASHRISLTNDDDFVHIDATETSKPADAESGKSKFRSLLGHLPYYRRHLK